MADDKGTDNQGGDDAGQSHLAAAEAFFANEAAAEKQAAVTPPAEKKPVAAKAPSVADALFKLPGQTPPVTEQPPGDDLDKKLAELKEPTGEKSRADWATMKTLLREERAARVKEQQEFKTKSEKTVDVTAVETAKARITELETLVQDYSTKLKSQDIRQHPEYVKEVEVPKNTIQGNMKTLLEVEGVEADISKLLTTSGKEFSKLVSEIGSNMSDFGKTQFYAQVQALKDVQARGESIVKSSDTFKEQSKQKALAEDRRVFQTVQKQFLSEEFVKPQAADEKASDEEKAAVTAFNAARVQVAQVAEQIAFGDASIQNVANTAHEAAMFKFLMNHGIPRMGHMFEAQIATRDAELSTLRARVASLEKAGSIELGGGGGTDTAAARPEQMSHIEAARHYGLK